MNLLHRRRQEEPEPKLGLTSEEGAALLLSEGKTKDPYLAAMMNDPTIPQLKSPEMLDAEQRDGLRKMMGFDFEVKVRPNKVHVFSLTGPRVTAHAKIKEGDVDKYGNITNPDLIDRMVAACVKLKERHDAALAKAEG